jgi:hypothetical protein
MSFRQPNRAWQEWCARHQAALHAIGLPPSVTLSESHWSDFLQNGYLEWHPESHDGFAFDQLSLGQMSQLLAILEASQKFDSEPMVGWLQFRLGRAS